MTLDKIQEPENLINTDIPRISLPSDKINLLWWADWYDGELSGFLEYENKKCYFHMVDQLGIVSQEQNPQYYRLYAIVPLTEEEFAEESKWHDLFRKYVGWHTDYLPGCCGKTQPQSEHHKYYDLVKDRKDEIPGSEFLNHEVIALMEM